MHYNKITNTFAVVVVKKCDYNLMKEIFGFFVQSEKAELQYLCKC